MTIFFNWQRIREITDLYLDKASAVLTEGTLFYPHAFGFMASVDQEQNGLHVAVPPRMVKDRKGFEAFVNYIGKSLPPQGRIEAAGFLLVLPRDVAAGIVDRGVGPAFDRRPDLVGLLHVEHVYDGIQTWLLNDPKTPEWNLIAKGIASNIPSCLPQRAYGTTVGTA